MSRHDAELVSGIIIHKNTKKEDGMECNYSGYCDFKRGFKVSEGQRFERERSFFPGIFFVLLQLHQLNSGRTEWLVTLLT